MKEIERFSTSFLSDNGLQIEEKILNKNIPLHWHEFYEIEFILSGSGRYLQNGISYPALPNTMFFSSYMDFHEIKCDTHLEILSIKFDERWVEPALSGELYQSAVFKKFDSALPIRLKQCFDEHNPHKKLYLENMLTCLLVEIIKNNVSPIAHSPLTDMSPAVMQAMQYIHLHFHENISATDIAKNSGYAVAHFSTIFKAQTGKSIKHHITAHRIEYAKRMLRYTDIPITDICYLSGFNAFSSFFRAFSETVNISPREYRKFNHQQE